MAASVLADAGFLIALLTERDRHHTWAATHASRFPPPWKTCEAVLSETFHLLRVNAPLLAGLLRRGAVVCAFRLDESAGEVLDLMEKYIDVPMSLADGVSAPEGGICADLARQHERPAQELLPPKAPVELLDRRG